MEYGFVKKNGNGRLLVCVLGWASGPETLQNFDVDGFDMLAVYDYRNTTIPKGLKEIVDRYQQIWIIGWSFGVYMAGRLADALNNPVMSLAVNGTSLPCSADYGIPPKNLELTVRSIAKTGTDKFYGRMCGGHMEGFTPVERNISELAEELGVLARIFEEKDGGEILWTDALIGTGDVIFPFSNMKRFWEERSPDTTVTVADIPHFPFTDAGTNEIRKIIGWKEKNL